MKKQMQKILVLVVGCFCVSYMQGDWGPPSTGVAAPTAQPPLPVGVTSTNQSAAQTPPQNTTPAATPVTTPVAASALTPQESESSDQGDDAPLTQATGAGAPDVIAPLPNNTPVVSTPVVAPATPSQPVQNSPVAAKPFSQPVTPVATPSFTPSSFSTNSSSSNEAETKTVTSGIDDDFIGDEESQKVAETVDTLHVKTGGNWLLKRVWWEKTEDVYEQIKEVFNKVMDTRMQFISERNKLDRELDIFYGEMGIEQGPLHDILSHAQDLMEKEKQEQGYLDKKEQAFVKKLEGKSRDLEQLKLDVKAIQEIDGKIDEALDTLFKQIDVCNQYEQKAWENFKEIARELNDKEARKLFYDTQGLYKDIQTVQAYITGEFSAYFAQTVQSAREHTAKISSQINGLKKEGIDLIKEAEILEKDEAPALKKEEDPKPEQKIVKKGWFAAFIDWLMNLLPASVKSWFVKVEKKAEPAVQAAKSAAQTVKNEAAHDYELVTNKLGTYEKELHDPIERSEHAVQDYFGYHDDEHTHGGQAVDHSMEQHDDTLPVEDHHDAQTDAHDRSVTGNLKDVELIMRSQSQTSEDVPAHNQPVVATQK